MVLLVGILGATVFVQPATAIFPAGVIRIRPEWNVPNNLTGYLTWKDGKGGISWNALLDGEGETAPADANLAFISDPLPRTLHLNVSRDIAVDVRAISYAAALGTRLTVGNTLLGGLTQVGNTDCSASQNPCAPDYPSDPRSRFRIAPELPILAAGSQIHLVFDMASGGKIGTGGKYPSVLRLHFFPEDEAFFRDPTLFGGAGAAGSLVPAQDMDYPSDSEGAEGAGAALGAALTLATGVLGGRCFRRRPSTALLACLLLLASLSGCAAVGDDARDGPFNGNNYGGDSTTHVIPLGGTESLAGGASGSLEGFVRDKRGQPVAGAFVSLLATSNFTTTTSFGHFEFLHLLPGSYAMEVKKDGFKAYATRVGVLAANTTLIAITLERLAANPSLDHTHDYFARESSITMLDGSVPNTCSSGVGSTTLDAYDSSQYSQICGHGRWIGIPLKRPGTSIPNLVAPGTGEVEVTLTWDDPAAPTELGFVVQANDESGTLYRYYLPRASGQRFHIQTSWEMTDPGHTAFTMWKFGFFIRDYDPYFDGHDPTDGLAGSDGKTVGRALDTHGGEAAWNIHVRIVLHRAGAFPVESGHRDFWGTTESLRLMSTVAKHSRSSATYVIYFSLSPAACTGPNPALTQPDANVLVWAPVDIVPPKTKWLEINTKQHRPNSLALTGEQEWVLYAHSANEPPATFDPKTADTNPSYRTASPPVVSEGGTNFTWRLPVAQDEADGYYATKTNWAFARVPYDYLRTCLGDLAYAAMDPTAASIMVTTITVTAHHDAMPT